MQRALTLWLLCIAVPCLGAAPLQAQARPPALQVPGTSASTEVHHVSIIQLIATPERFHGKRVRVVGYLWLEFEGNGIYLSESDRTHGVYKNGLWVSFAEGVLDSRQAYSGRYVLLEGTFNAEAHGHLGLWSGTIEQITRALPWR